MHFLASPSLYIFSLCVQSVMKFFSSLLEPLNNHCKQFHLIVLRCVGIPLNNLPGRRRKNARISSFERMHLNSLQRQLLIAYHYRSVSCVMSFSNRAHSRDQIHLIMRNKTWSNSATCPRLPLQIASVIASCLHFRSRWKDFYIHRINEDMDVLFLRQYI